MTGDVSVITSYRLMEGTPAPPAQFIPQGPPPRIPTDSALEVVSQLELMNLLAALRILGPDVARRALEFIADGTIRATPLNKNRPRWQWTPSTALWKKRVATRSPQQLLP
uniref:Uncharacterized protein n=1 Tax=Romanomermis culicivorax TaxID=13658 RepID=A0A915HEM3_ROMCU